jgi:hypothetical protein
MNFKIVILILAFPLFFEKCSCTKEGCFDESYSFELFIKASPDMDSVFINDTIWFEINEPTVLKDNISGRTINYENAANLGSAVAFGQLLGNSQEKDAVIDFNFLLISGIETNSVNAARFKEYLFKEESGKYIFRLGIIPKKSGIFRIGFSAAANVYRRNQNCGKAFFKIYFKQTNQHLYFNDQNFGIATPLPSNMYCFKVK